MTLSSNQLQRNELGQTLGVLKQSTVEFRWTIGDVIWKLRTERGWTQPQLANKAGLDKSVIVRAEKEPDRVEIRTLKNIAAAFGVSVTFFYDRVEEAEWGAELRELPASNRATILAGARQQRRPYMEQDAPDQTQTRTPTDDTPAATRDTSEREKKPRRNQR